MNKKYFKYLSKSHKNLSIFLLILNVVAITFTYFVSYMNGVGSTIEIVMSAGTIVNIFVSLCLPLLYFSFMDTKKGGDHYWALPIKRSQIVITTIVFMILQAFFAYLIAYVPVLLFDWLVEGYQNFKVLQIGSMLLMIACAIITSTAVKMKFYSTIDSAIGLLGYICLPIIVYLSIMAFITNISYGLISYSYLDIEYFFYPYALFTSGSLLPMVDTYSRLSKDLVPFIFEIIAIAGISLLSIRYDIKNRKAEYANTLSNNVLAYPMLIRIATLALLVIAITTFSQEMALLIITLAVIFVCYLVMNFVATRAIRINKKILIFYTVAVLIVFSGVKIGDMTNGFGLTQSYQNLSLKQYGVYIIVENPKNEDVNYEFRLEDSHRIDPETEKIIKELQGEFIKKHKNTDAYTGINSDYSLQVNTSLSASYEDNKEFYYHENGYAKENDGHYLIHLSNETLDLMERLVQSNTGKLEMAKFKYMSGEQEYFQNFEDFKQELINIMNQK